MKLVTFVEPVWHRRRLGAIVNDGVIDLTLCYMRLLKDEGEPRPRRVAIRDLPPSMKGFLWGGKRSLEAARKAFGLASELISAGKEVTGPEGEKAYYRLSEVKLKAPIPRPGKIIHTAGNFREHAYEAERAGWEFPIPQWISFLKSPSSVIGPEEAIVYPKLTKELDYEIEMAIVIGKKGKHIPREKAYDYIAGYTVFNDITARDIQRREMKAGLINFGKNLDTFAPMGPCLALKDEVPDPHSLKMELRVNGEVRQSSSTRNLSVTIAEIVERYSAVTLEPGDIITTGTVSGVAAFRPTPDRYYLKPGDIVEAEIERIGTLRNPVVAEP